MRKILIYCHVFYPQNTGYANAFLNFINSILDTLDDVYITVVTPYSLEGKEEIRKDRLDIVRLTPKVNIKKVRYFLNEYFYAKEVSNKFKSENYDLLLVETFDQPIFLSSLDSSIYNKTIVRIHSTSDTEYTIFDKSIDFKIKKFFLQKFVSKRVLNIASTNSFHIEFAKKHYFDENVIEIGNKNFFIIPNPIKIDNQFIDLNVGDKLKLFILGRMEKLGFNQKGFLDFIYALKLLDSEVLNRFEITIVGSGSEKSRIISLTQEFNNITFIDQLEHAETIQFLKESDVIVLPSRYEGLSMFALEGLSTGNAVLFSKTGGLIDLVDGNGLFFEPQNIDSLAESLIKISNFSKEEVIKMKSKSIQIAKEKYSPFLVASKFDSICKIIR